jgi:hypothetical protein
MTLTFTVAVPVKTLVEAVTLFRPKLVEIAASIHGGNDLDDFNELLETLDSLGSSGAGVMPVATRGARRAIERHWLALSDLAIDLDFDCDDAGDARDARELHRDLWLLLVNLHDPDSACASL